MKTFNIILLLLVARCMAELDINSKWQYLQEENSCEQNDHNCKECLRQESCSWCGVDAGHSFCIPSNICPYNLQHSSCPINRQNLEDQLENLHHENREQIKNLHQENREKIKNVHHEKRVIFDVPQVTLNATYLCHLKRNCTVCTRSGFCAWCTEKNTCVPYSGALTTSLCGSRSWSKNQCISKGAAQVVKPCPLRSSGCKECVADKYCYWCDSTKTCDYYQGDGIEPANCTSGNWYYQKCTSQKAIIVLLPILIIIGTPIISYIVMYCVLCAMKKAGYDVLDDSDSSDDEDKIRKPIMLKHDSPGSKTDRLRKKYGLDKKP